MQSAMTVNSRNVLRWLRVVAFWTLCILAAVLCFGQGGALCVGLPLAWGAILAAGMVRGLRSAPLEAWTRHSSNLTKFSGYTFLSVLFLLPVIVPGVLFGFLTALGAAWLIVVGGCTSTTVYPPPKRGTER